MRLPQRSSAIKAIILALLLGTTATAEEDDGRVPLFSCGTETGVLSLSAVPDASGGWSGLAFDRTGRGNGHADYSFHPAPEASSTSFLFSHSDGDEGYLVSIRWTDGGRDYVYYSLAIPPDASDANDAGGGAAGLVVSAAGQMVDAVDCAERPEMFIGYMREAMSCDTANPFGPEACTEQGATRHGSLDMATIGIVP